jgi:hypothetical protein
MLIFSSNIFEENIRFKICIFGARANSLEIAFPDASRSEMR